ncbi:MAG: Fe-S cluster assembly protein SufD [Chlorobi bacterium]|nr:Fe-S cluster assembly protein SufD [Chlorobiota bacterium]
MGKEVLRNKTPELTRMVLDRFEKTGTSVKTGLLPAVKIMQQKGREAFLTYGIPGYKNEKYRFTPVQKYFEKNIPPLMVPRNRNFKLDDIFRCDIPTLNTFMHVVLNGFYFEETSSLGKMEDGIRIGGLRQAMKEMPGLVSKYLNLAAGESTDGLVALNAAFATDGFFIYVPDNVVMEKPVQVVNIVNDNQSDLVQYRNLIVLGKNSEARIVVCDHTLSEYESLSNSVTEVFMDREARLDMTRLQNENNNATNITHTFIRQEARTLLNNNHISLHGGHIRNNLDIVLVGSHAKSHANGLFLMDHDQHVDNHVFVSHAAPECFSNQLYKGVLNNNATGVFSGKILVEKGAQKTEAYQVNKNILLTDTAKMNSKPQLEIYADDVKCTHGATVGQLDEEAMFYLRSRGIRENDARLMLMYAFAHDVVRKIRIEVLQDRITELVEKRLKGDIPKCHTCLVNYS